MWFILPLLEEENDVILLCDIKALGIANNMHDLRHLQLIGHRMRNTGLRAILDGCPHLDTLDIRRCHNVKMDADKETLGGEGRWRRLPAPSPLLPSSPPPSLSFPLPPLFDLFYNNYVQRRHR